MKVDALLAAANMAGIDDDSWGEEQKAALEDAATRFLLAGGTVSMTEWAALGGESRASLAAAGIQAARSKARAFVEEALEAAGEIGEDWAPKLMIREGWRLLEGAAA